MTSELQRIAAELMAVLDQIPDTVAQLHKYGEKTKRQAAHISDLSDGTDQGRHRALLLFDAAQRIDEAARLAIPAHTQGRPWAMSLVNGGTIRSTPGGSGRRTQVSFSLERPVTEPSETVPTESEGPLALSTTNPDHKSLLAAPPADSTIVVDGQFTYTTDDSGRVVLARATLNTYDPDHPRDDAAQADLTSKIKGVDHAGHLFARIFRGPGDLVNLVAMHGNDVNLSRYKRLENRWKSAIVDGREVAVSVKVLYRGESRRPRAFKVIYEVDGKMYEPDVIVNTLPRGKS